MKIRIQAAVVALFAASVAQAQQAVQWKISDGGNGHWYRLFHPDQPLVWSAAKSAAAAAGGHLVVITTSAEDAQVAKQIADSVAVPWGAGIDPEGGWIGASKLGGSWSWCNGEPWEFTSWNQSQCAVGGGNQPDADGLSRYLQVACVAGSRCQWDDICQIDGAGDCTRPFYIVEWSADCNNDGIVDYGQCLDGTLPDYNGNSVPDCCERNQACTPGNYAVQWKASDGGNGHWYLFLPVGSFGAWNNASDTANGFGGYLATITSGSELAFVESLAPCVGCPGYGPSWAIGGRQYRIAPDYVEPGGGWKWITGETWSFAPWAPGEPNNEGGAEDFLFLHCNLHGFNDGGDPSNGCIAAVFEWSADCNGDGIVDYGQILQGELADLNSDGVPDICQQPSCADADLFRNGVINGADLGILLSEWGSANPSTVSDINHDGVVNGADLGILLSFWGPCP